MSKQSPRLAGKVAVVTGGGRGVGRAIARALADNGARVLIADLGTRLDGSGVDASVAEAAALEISSTGATCMGLTVDVTDDEAPRAIVEAASSAYGRIDVLVHAAGNLTRGTVFEVDSSHWDQTLAVHVSAALRLTQEVAHEWSKEEGKGRRVILISSESGLYGEPTYVAYGVAKAAVIALALGSAEPLRTLGATCNVFIPQAKTRMTAAIPIDEFPEQNRWVTDEFAPENATPAVVYLASDESDWLTGQIIGGWGYEVHQYTGANRSRTIVSPGPWNIDSLFAAFRSAFTS